MLKIVRVVLEWQPHPTYHQCYQTICGRGVLMERLVGWNLMKSASVVTLLRPHACIVRTCEYSENMLSRFH